MTDLTPYVIGANASCTDGACGQVSRVIIEAATTTVTHLVIEPEDKHQPDRLVPLDLLAQRERSLAPLLGSGVLPARQRRKEAVCTGNRRLGGKNIAGPISAVRREPARTGREPSPARCGRSRDRFSGERVDHRTTPRSSSRRGQRSLISCL